jgi:stearoyl-CoA desaturase (delta-9 desaturase)|tara:strand:+ start:904 stop:2115 length:1212 start_codon:yes stop_codon:yes gene_type:complete
MITLPWWGYVLVVLSLTHLTIVSVTVYLHRHQAHRALTLHPGVSHFFRAWLWLTTGIITREWVAVHRKHHAKVETWADPHSPQVLGIHKVLWLGLLLYRKEAADKQTLSQYGSGTPTDWFELNLYSRFPNLGIISLLALQILFLGLASGTLIWLIQMIWIPFWAAGVINGMGHFWGYRNYEVKDASRNIVPWGILIGGEELHNNHHAFASSARFSTRTWELDLGWFYIRTLERLNLAQVFKLPPVTIVRPDNTRCDLETVRALVNNRFEIMAQYASEVLSTVCQEEAGALVRLSRTNRKLLRQASRLITREQLGLSPKAREHLSRALALSPRIHTVYEAKLRLQEIWQRSSTTSENLVHQLEHWCHTAEASGIESLQAFSNRLKGYKLLSDWPAGPTRQKTPA